MLKHNCKLWASASTLSQSVIKWTLLYTRTRWKLGGGSDLGCCSCFYLLYRSLISRVLCTALISGVVSGFCGAGLGGLTFITTFNLLSNQAYFHKKYDWIDFRLKNMAIFLASDLAASITRLPFETRKQLVQMANYDLDMSVIVRNSKAAIIPLMARDISFRFILLSTYYSTTQIDHEPKLKYSVPQIVHYMKLRRDAGYDDSMKSMQGLIYDYHHYNIKTGYLVRFWMTIFGNLLATIVTNPIDVALTKIMTQHPKKPDEMKYKGLISTMKTIYTEEGAWKFASGVHPRFMFNLFNAFLYMFAYNRFMDTVNKLNL